MTHHPLRAALLTVLVTRVTTNLIRRRGQARRRRRFVWLAGTLAP